MQPHDKLFIPGPVEVSAKTMAAFSRPMIGHRGEDFKNLYRDIHPKLQMLFGTKQPVFLSTSSAWGVMEAAIRNLVGRGVLCCMCGAFSDKWIDVMLTGAQKALALPPGFSLFSVSEKAFARAEKQKDRGYYFDFLEFKKQQNEFMTPSTPSIGHIFALQSKLEDIFAETLPARFTRHARTNALVHDWVAGRGFEFFAEENFRSLTLTCVKNNREINVAKLVRDLREDHHLVIDGGYGKIKGQTFRLSNMGDETEETVAHLLACLDNCLG